MFSTFGGKPVAAQAGLAVLDVIRDERIVPHVHRVAESLRLQLEQLKSRHEAIVAVRAFGLRSASSSTTRAVRRRSWTSCAAVACSSAGPGPGTTSSIRPPLVFRDEHGSLHVAALDAALA